MDNYITYLIGAVLLLNLISFIIVGVDKSRSVDNAERVPEVYFFFLASCFASLGVFLGMFLFRHKTKKFYFPLGIGILFFQQAALIFCIIKLIN